MRTTMESKLGPDIELGDSKIRDQMGNDATVTGLSIPSLENILVDTSMF